MLGGCQADLDTAVLAKVLMYLGDVAGPTEPGHEHGLVSCGSCVWVGFTCPCCIQVSPLMGINVLRDASETRGIARAVGVPWDAVCGALLLCSAQL